MFNIFWTCRIGQFKHLKINEVKKTTKHLFHVKFGIKKRQHHKMVLSCVCRIVARETLHGRGEVARIVRHVNVRVCCVNVT